VKVIVDAHMLGESEGGNETYVAGLLEGLDRLSSREGLSITALSGPHRPQLPDLPNVQLFPVGRRGDAWRLFVEVPWACWQLHADVLHMTYHAPPWLPCPLILSIHDVLFRRFPEHFSPRDRLLLSTLMPLSIRKAALILTLSEASKQEIERLYPFARHKTEAIPLAAGSVAKVTPSFSSLPMYVQGCPFVLAVGRIQPRKNLPRLIRAYALVRKRISGEMPLVLVGPPEWKNEKIKALAGETEYANDIHFTGFIDEPTLAAFYRRASVFVFPSLAEGFGLPVLEAMACGAPVIASNSPPLPEVAGNAALLVDPHSVEEIAQAIEGVLTDCALQDDLRDRGEKQAARFSWKRTAELTLAAYRRAVRRVD
jgi:glycosyltransferase involved in cell wall biosynthesis